jgi:signal transduction histidine kinase
MLTTKAPLRDRHANVIGIVGVNRDITERKQAEQLVEAVNADLARSQRELFEVLTNLKAAHAALQATQMQLVEAEKMQTVARLAAGVAHEVKNPLAILRMGVDYLETHETTQRHDVAQVLHDMVEALDRADGVINGLLDFSTPHELQMAEMDLNLVIEQALRLVRHELAPARIRLVRQLAADLPRVRLDPVRLQQVFINLFSNAAQAMPDRGTLTLRTYGTQLAPEDVSPAAGDRSGAGFHAGDVVVVAEVDDTGVGIPAENQTKLFEPFFTTKATGQGQGLGLTVARRIVELHGGTLQLRNRPEGGARATLRFKASRNP